MAFFKEGHLSELLQVESSELDEIKENSLIRIWKLKKYVFLTCSWHQKTKPRINQFTNLKCCIKAREPFKTPFLWCIILIFYFQKHFKPCFFILIAFKDILQHFKFVIFFFWCHEQISSICTVSPTEFPSGFGFELMIISLKSPFFWVQKQSHQKWF